MHEGCESIGPALSDQTAANGIVWRHGPDWSDAGVVDWGAEEIRNGVAEFPGSPRRRSEPHRIRCVRTNSADSVCGITGSARIRPTVFAESVRGMPTEDEWEVAAAESAAVDAE